jgi:integrase
MVDVKIRYLVTKPQKGGHTLYYWQPNKALKDAGFLTRRLAERSNQLSDAIREAEALNAEVDAWRAGLVKPAIRHGTLPWLIRVYQTDTAYTALAAKTRDSYDHCLRVIEAWSLRAGHPPVASLQRRHVRDFYRAMEETPAKANAVLRVLRLLLNFARDEGVIDENPAAKARLKTLPPRDAVWSAEAIARFCEEARSAGRPSMALAVLLAANLGQRQGDILRLAWSAYDGQTVTLRQGKTGKLIAVPATTELCAELEATPRRSPSIVVSETTGRPYLAYNFRHLFREIADQAGIGEDLWFLDLRRTAVVRLAEAGCEIYEISAITGHSLTQTVKILEVYLPRNAVMARNAITKLSEHRKRTKLEA